MSDGREITVYLDDHRDDEGNPIALYCAELEIIDAGYLVIRWFPGDEQVEVIPERRLLSALGVFEGYELDDEDIDLDA